jgi:ABC-2 type transport system permease protein
VWTVVLKAPNSPMSVGFSLFPPATPFLMLLRLALHPGPPMWQAALGIGLTVASTMICVWAAGRIFRIGLLMQGKAPSYVEMVRWVFMRG